MSDQPHDNLARGVFMHPEHAAGELQHILPPELSARIDWSTLKLVPGAFVDEALQATFSDLLFSVLLDGRDGYFYLLLEHRSSPEKFQILRLLKYIVRFYERWLSDHPGASKLPVVIPIVLSHGRTWTCPLRFEELIDLPAATAPLVLEFVPKFRALLDDLSAVSDEALRARAMSDFARVTLWCLKHATNTG
jgi:predicted transposase/invertase (TIGR01784 family)